MAGLAVESGKMEFRPERVESVPGQGSTFSAVLPRVARVAPVAEPEAAAEPAKTARPPSATAQ